MFLASTVREILGGSRNSKIWSRDPHMTPFGPILNFFFLELTAFHLRAKFEVFSFNRSRDIRGAQNYKIGSRDSHMTPFDRILHFSLELTAIRLRAKFEVACFNGSRDIRVVPKFQKWVT